MSHAWAWMTFEWCRRSPRFSGTALVINAANGLASKTHQTLTSSDAAQPLGWAPIATNVTGKDANFTTTNAVNAQRLCPGWQLATLSIWQITMSLCVFG